MIWHFRFLLAPAIAWTVHFIIIYGAISAACASRALFGHPTVILIGAAATVIALAVCLWPLIHPGTADRHLSRAIRYGAFIFGVAIVFDAGFLFFFDSCGG